MIAMATSSSMSVKAFRALRYTRVVDMAVTFLQRGGVAREAFPDGKSKPGNAASVVGVSCELVCDTMRGHRCRRADRAPGRYRAGAGWLGGGHAPAVVLFLSLVCYPL